MIRSDRRRRFARDFATPLPPCASACRTRRRRSTRSAALRRFSRFDFTCTVPVPRTPCRLRVRPEPVRRTVRRPSRAPERLAWRNSSGIGARTTPGAARPGRALMWTGVWRPAPSAGRIHRYRGRRQHYAGLCVMVAHDGVERIQSVRTTAPHVRIRFPLCVLWLRGRERLDRAGERPTRSIRTRVSELRSPRQPRDPAPRVGRRYRNGDRLPNRRALVETKRLYAPGRLSRQ